jgi:hypothetical protein
VEETPDWVFYVVASVLGGTIIAVRLAIIEVPKVKISYRRGYPFEILDTWEFDRGAQLHRVRRYLISVTNVSYKDLKCLAKIVDLRDNLGTEFAFLPVGIRTEHQRYQGRTGDFNLRSGEHKMLEILTMDEANLNSEIQILYERPDIVPSFVRRDRKYVLEIAVYGAGSPVKKRFMFFVRNDDLILESFDEVDELAQANMVVNVLG